MASALAVLVNGLPGSGKTTLARALEPIAGPRLSASAGTAEQACASDENQDQPYAHQDG